MTNNQVQFQRRDQVCPTQARQEVYPPDVCKEAVLGANSQAPTPSGVVDLKIPASSMQGHKLRPKGRGLTGKRPGDL